MLQKWEEIACFQRNFIYCKLIDAASSQLPICRLYAMHPVHRVICNLYVRIFLFLAKVAICDVGSDPMDKIQTSGVRGSDSDHVASKSNICISLYSGPRDSVHGEDKLIISFSINDRYEFILGTRTHLQCISLPVKWFDLGSMNE